MKRRYELRKSEDMNEIRERAFQAVSPDGKVLFVFIGDCAIVNLNTMNFMKVYSSNKGDFVRFDGKRYYINLENVY